MSDESKTIPFKLRMPDLSHLLDERIDFDALPEPGPGISHFMSGEPSFAALMKAVSDLTSKAPQDHDVLIQAFGINVTQVRYVGPHTFLSSGYDQNGNCTEVVTHFSQLVARVVFIPKRGPERAITGFSRTAPNQ